MARFGRQIDLTALTRNAVRLQELSRGAAKRVVSRATSTLRRRLATETRRFVSEEYGVGVRELGKRITTEANGDTVTVYGTTPRLPLIAFGGHYGGRRAAGATAQIVRGEKKTYAHAFLSKGGKNIVARGINKATGKRYGRLPVVVLHGPTPESMVLGGGAPATANTPANRATALAEEVLNTEIERLINVEMKA